MLDVLAHLIRELMHLLHAITTFRGDLGYQTPWTGRTVLATCICFLQFNHLD